MSALDPILAPWSFTAMETRSFLVMPDGCRDFIVRLGPGTRGEAFLSPLMRWPERVAARKGERFFGIRLRPGAGVDEAALQRFQGLPRETSCEALIDFARNAATLSAHVDEALSCLADVKSSALAARRLGVSLRTLQRHTLRATGQGPDFWRRLARARKAARAVLDGLPLSQTAHDCQYADQAHMTRDLARWFFMTPGDMAAGREDARHPARSLREVGYDPPATGEQSSIK